MTEVIEGYEQSVKKAQELLPGLFKYVVNGLVVTYCVAASS